ncbi:MAG: ribosome maturation factor RimP [Alphaproteobacteria bacterium]|nr:ribosome maturation factor RimP [Alphaproteobacteria bacterium]
MEQQKKIETLVTPTLDTMGYELLRVKIQSQPQKTLQIMAERRDRRTMTVEDCATISRALSAILDVEDPIQGAYALEVSSPGIDRPLVRLGDFTRFAGHEAKLETSRTIGGRRRFRGRLAGLTEGGGVLITVEGETLEVPFAEMEKAKLILTDELITATLNEQEHEAG